MESKNERGSPDWMAEQVAYVKNNIHLLSAGCKDNRSVREKLIFATKRLVSSPFKAFVVAVLLWNAYQIYLLQENVSDTQYSSEQANRSIQDIEQKVGEAAEDAKNAARDADEANSKLHY